MTRDQDPHHSSREEIHLKTENLLDEGFASPEDSLNSFCLRVAQMPDLEPFLEAKRVAVDVDDLFSQIRWHIGQDLQLLVEYPDLITDTPKRTNPFEFTGIPIEVPLLLRKYVLDARKVLFSDFRARRRGVPVAGWVFHMMIDGAIFRSVALLDRLARISFLVAPLPQTRIYFRSGQMATLAARFPCPETSQLAKIASGDVLSLLIDYRDGFTHTRMALSYVSGPLLSKRIITDDGKEKFQDERSWPPSYLVAVANAGYSMSIGALAEVTSFVDRQTPQSKYLEGEPKDNAS